MVQHTGERGKVFVKRISLTEAVLWAHKGWAHKPFYTKCHERGLKGVLERLIWDSLVFGRASLHWNRHTHFRNHKSGAAKAAEGPWSLCHARKAWSHPVGQESSCNECRGEVKVDNELETQCWRIWVSQWDIYVIIILHWIQTAYTLGTNMGSFYLALKAAISVCLILFGFLCQEFLPFLPIFSPTLVDIYFWIISLKSSILLKSFSEIWNWRT